MPTYKYECSACGHGFELFQSMTDSVKKKCPSCGKSKLQRLIGAGAGILFKGSGFYETDYRSSSYQAAAKADSGGDGKKSDSSASGGGSGDGASSGKADRAKPATGAKKSAPKSGSDG